MLTDINGKDLVATECKTHEKCYQDYTRILYEKGHKTVKLMIKTIIKEEQVIQSNVCISMKLMRENYVIGQGQHQYQS